MASMITEGGARFEIYEPSLRVRVCVCVISHAHAHIYEVDLERVCVERG